MSTDGAAALFAPDGVWHDVGAGIRCVGREAMSAFWSCRTYAPLRVRITGLAMEGPRFATEWERSGVHSGPLPGYPATGRPFRVSGVAVGEDRDGPLLRVAEDWNLCARPAQVGLLAGAQAPAPAGAGLPAWPRRSLPRTALVRF